MNDICACLGPRDDEPYCMCEMIRRGLKTSKDYEWSQEEKDRLTLALNGIFNKREQKKNEISNPT